MTIYIFAEMQETVAAIILLHGVSDMLAMALSPPVDADGHADDMRSSLAMFYLFTATSYREELA